MHKAGFLLFVVSPFYLTTLGGGWIPGISEIGRIALIAQQWIADVLAGAFKLPIGPEKTQRMVDRHDGQVLAGHSGDNPAPETGTYHHVIGADESLGSVHAPNPGVFDFEAGGWIIGKGLELAGCHGLFNELADHSL